MTKQNRYLATILALPYSHTLSHLSRPLAVARELKKRGHKIVFGADSPKKAFIRDVGFEVLPIHEPDPDTLFGNIRAGKLRFVSADEIERMIAADLSLYQKVRPDLIVSDGRFSAPVSAQVAGIKHAAIVNVSSTEYRALPYVPFFEWIPGKLAPGKNRLWTLLNRLNLKLEMMLFDKAMPSFTRISRKNALAKTITATNCLTGVDLTLMADVPQYFPTKMLPPDYHYIGPLTWRSSVALPIWWPPDTGSAPLIYISMGTTGIANFFEIVHGLILESEFRAIVTTGGQSDRLETQAGKIYVEPYLDGDMVMEICDLVVCHGGNGTIYQALSHGRPVIGIPTIPDQKFNMRRVETLGLGRMLSWRDLSANPHLLIEAIQSVLNTPSFAANARSMQSILQSYPSTQMGADRIETLL